MNIHPSKLGDDYKILRNNRGDNRCERVEYLIKTRRFNDAAYLDKLRFKLIRHKEKYMSDFREMVQFVVENGPILAVGWCQRNCYTEYYSSSDGDGMLTRYHIHEDRDTVELPFVVDGPYNIAAGVEMPDIVKIYKLRRTLCHGNKIVLIDKKLSYLDKWIRLVEGMIDLHIQINHNLCVNSNGDVELCFTGKKLKIGNGVDSDLVKFVINGNDYFYRITRTNSLVKNWWPHRPVPTLRLN